MSGNLVSQLLELPLLRRELLSGSRRPQTWWIRCAISVVLCGLLIIAWGLWQYRLQKKTAAGLGAGQEIAELVLLGSLLAMSLLLPAFTCSAIASERERGSLELLLLSRLNPHVLILEKFLIQLLLPVTVLLLMAPLLGAAYALGGIPVSGMIGAAVAVLVTAILINSAGILCSALFQSTAIAFLATFVLLLLFVAVPGILVDFGVLPQWDLWEQVPSFGQWPLAAFLPVTLQGLEGRQSLSLLVVTCIPPLTLSVLMIGLSSLTVTHWPHEAPLNDRRKRLLEAWWRQTCSRGLKRFWGRGPAISTIPADAVQESVSCRQPPRQHQQHSSIALREIKRNEQAHWKAHLAYCAVLLIGLYWTSTTLRPHEFWMFAAFFQVFFLILSLFLVLAVTSNTFAAERQRLTLDLLLVLPISNRQLVAEKMAASNLVASRVLLPNVLLLVSKLFVTRVGQQTFSEILLYLLCALGHLLILIRLTGWISLWFSLRMKTSVSTIQGSLTSLMALCAGPLLLTSVLFVVLLHRSPWSLPAWYLSSPMLMFMSNEIQWLPRNFGMAQATQLVVFSLVAYGLLERVIHRRVFRDVTRLLNRLDGTESAR